MDITEPTDLEYKIGMRARARRDFQVGPKRMGIFPILNGDICNVLSSDGKQLTVEPKRGGWFGITNWTDWELVTA